MNTFSKYRKTFELGIQNSLEYRTDFLLSLISVIFPIILQYFLWTAIYSSSKKIIYGYTYEQMIVYSIMAGMISKLIATGFEYDIYNDIKNGGFSKFIVQPIGYFEYKISSFLGQKLIQGIIIVSIISVALIIMNEFSIFNITITRFLFFLITLFLALILNYLIAYSLSAISFWVGEISYLFQMTSMIVNIVSGGVLPINVFGNKILSIFKFLPFQYTVYYPVNVIDGVLSNSEIIEGIMFQCIWIVLFFLISKVVWKFGSKKYMAIGG